MTDRKIPLGNKNKTDYSEKERLGRKLYDNPYLQNPKAFAKISQRARAIQNHFQENEEPNDGFQKQRIEPASGGMKVENRAMVGLFTSLLMIQSGSQQHYVFREHYYTDHKVPPFRGRYHKHDFIEVFYVIEGRFEQILLGESRSFSAGEVVITDRNCEHADLITEEPGTVLFLWIQSDFLDQILRYYDGTDNLQRFLFHTLREQQSEQQYLHLLPKAGNEEIEYILEQLVRESYKKGPGFQDIIKWNLLRLFHLLCEQYTLQLYRSGQEGKERMLLYEVEQYIGLHLADVTVQKLENHFHYHRNYYNLLLKKYLNQSFRGYIQQHRMEQAAVLLTSTNMTVKQIAEQVGYENSSFFYHLFERCYQIAPLAYRERFQKTNEPKEKMSTAGR